MCVRLIIICVRSLVRTSIGCDYVGWDYKQMGVVATLDLEVQNEFNRTAWQVRMLKD